MIKMRAALALMTLWALALPATAQNVYHQFSPGGALTGTWKSQILHLDAGSLLVIGIDPVANGGTGVATLTGIAKGNGTSAFSAAAAADILGLWSGTCSSTTYLRGDGACVTPGGGGGGGTVTSVAITVPSGFSASGSPVTTSGTLAISGVLNPAAGGIGVGTLSGIAKGNGTSAFTAAASADIYGLWSGTCSSSTYLRGDGACVTPGGGGTVTSAGISSTDLSVSGSPITGASSITLNINAAAVSLAKMANLAANSLICNNTGSAATPIACTTAQAKSLLAIASSDVSGLAASATTDTTVASNLSSGILPAGRMPAHTGDCTSSAGAVALTCTKTSGVAFATSATTDATNATNITSGTLAAARGGTGVNNATRTLTITGNPATFAAPASGNIGTLELVQNAQSGNYTTVLADSGKHLYHTSTSAHTFTIDSNANVAYPVGTTLTFVNENSGGLLTIAITTDTLYLSPAGSTGSRTLSALGVATAIKIDSTHWVISGAGLT